jgi:phage shock protein A
MSFFSRIFKISQAETHSLLDKFEDPIKITEQGIRDLRKDLQEAMASLAEVKGMAIRTRRDAEGKKKLAADYERKAMMLLQKMQKGQLDGSQAESLATEALNRKDEAAKDALHRSAEAQRHEEMAKQLQANVNQVKSTITTYENDLMTLKARAKTAAASKKINRQIAKIDSSGTISMLEKMKARVEEDEALAVAYGEMASVEKSLDEDIHAALEAGAEKTPSQSLLDLKKKLGIE